MVFQEYLHHLDEIDGRLKRLDAAIHLEATESERAPVIQALQTLRGVAEVTAGVAQCGCHHSGERIAWVHRAIACEVKNQLESSKIV